METQIGIKKRRKRTEMREEKNKELEEKVSPKVTSVRQRPEEPAQFPIHPITETKKKGKKRSNVINKPVGLS